MMVEGSNEGGIRKRNRLMAGEAHLGEARRGENSRARLGSGWDPREKGIGWVAQ